MTPPIVPLMCYSLRGFDPSERFAFVVAVNYATAYGYIWAQDQGRLIPATWCDKTGTIDSDGSNHDLLSPLPNHPLPDCLKHLRPEPVAWRRRIKGASHWEIQTANFHPDQCNEFFEVQSLAPIIGQ